MKIIFYFFIFLIIAIFILVSAYGCGEEAFEWKKVAEGQWTLTNKTCMNENPLKYRCIENCYEKSHKEIWNFCKDKGKERVNIGTLVLCFPTGCIPEVKNNSCSLACPLA